MSDGTRKGAHEKVNWSAECEDAFSTLKETLTAEPILQLLDLSKSFILRTDASNTEIEYTLLQEGRSEPNILFFQ